MVLVAASILSVFLSGLAYRTVGLTTAQTFYLKWAAAAVATTQAAAVAMLGSDRILVVAMTLDVALRLTRKTTSLTRSLLASVASIAASFYAFNSTTEEVLVQLSTILAVASVLDLVLKAVYMYHASMESMLQEGPLGETLGSQRPLNPEDLYKLRDCDETEQILARYKQVKKPNRYLLFSLLLVAWKPFAIQMFCSILQSVLAFGNPFFLYLILTWIQAPREDKGDLTEGWILILGLFFCNIINSVVSGQLYFHGRRTGRTMRAILISEIFGKSMRRVAGIAAPKKAAAAAAAAVPATPVDGEEATAAPTAEEPKEGEDAEASLGKIATLMSVDTERFTEFICYVQDPLINFPISITLAFIGLYNVIGLSALAGLSVIVLSGPISTFFGSWVNKVQEEYMKSVDKRVAITNETLNGIRIIKYFSWEDQFQAKILAARAIELKNLLKLSFIYITLHISNFSYSILCFFVTFSFYTVVEGKTLDAATAFSAVLLLERLTELLGWAPQLVMWVMKSKVALDRCVQFLRETELEKYDEDFEEEHVEGGPVLGFKMGHFRYFNQEDAALRKKEQKERRTAAAEGNVYQAVPQQAGSDEGDLVSGPEFKLKDLTIDFMVGGLNVVTGPTGGGKSSLILALLGEMKSLGGRAFLPKESSDADSSVAYVAQTAWLLNATIRDNILMGLEFEEKRYREALEACSLVRDLETFAGGDLTEIGEKGVSISGGQKQRISLARAVYSNASVVLLDDPLSAVDAPTARHLLKYAILGALKGRTVILVTHAVSLTAPFADHVVILQNGEVVSQGTPTEIASDSNVPDITHQMLAQTVVLTDEDDTNISSEKKPEQKDVVADAQDATKLVDEEQRATGSVSLKVYKTYWDACGGLFFLFSFIFFQWAQSGANLSTDWWLSRWTNAAKINSTLPGNFSSFATFGPHAPSQAISNLPLSFSASFASVSSQVSTTSAMDLRTMISTLVPLGGLSPSDTMFYITVYGLLGFSKVLVAVVLNLINVFGAIRASRSLHQSLLASILGAPLRFFETTPLGRILNRFSKDISTIDEDVMNSIFYFFHQLVKGATIIAVISYSAPWFLLSFFPIFYTYMSITQKYLNVSRELKRLQSVSRSPIFSLFSECLAGVTTVRAYNQTSRFSQMSSDRVNQNHKAFYLLWTANRWLCIRTDMISAVVILCAGAAVISGNVNAGMAALTLTYAGQFSEALLWVVRMHADMEMSLNSVERCREYMDIEQEPARVVENYRPAAEWPQKGEIQVKGLSVRYGGEDQPFVLNGVTFETRPGEKIGVVGRTGAGKSTLSLAFFRIIPLAEGSITIDGMDIGRMGLSDLRSKLTIIPQDPVLFTGTVRSNLDPHGECDDAELWHVLRSTHVLDSVNGNNASSSSNGDSSSGSSSATLTPGVSYEDLAESSGEVTLANPSLKRVSSSSTMKSTTSGSSGNSLTLDSPVTENGGNFSQGQRQLLCMARALLRKSKVIFLDEATASIDASTDAKIQQTIREELKDATILTIAHRLKTVVDYDRVLVLDRGQVVEFGTPTELIEKENGGYFRKMCEDSGEIGELIKVANRAEAEKAMAAGGSIKFF
ncbi:UNVERIFIED_CONTAM: hypothetical protein HDU68_010951 [Siphonaria sp. JEL0065]|nr:hypothetical protein HDU68_010951 [Siphonaria sp. JEL0065]